MKKHQTTEDLVKDIIHMCLMKILPDGTPLYYENDHYGNNNENNNNTSQDLDTFIDNAVIVLNDLELKYHEIIKIDDFNESDNELYEEIQKPINNIFPWFASLHSDYLVDFYDLIYCFWLDD